MGSSASIISDPWGQLSASDALARIRAEDGEVVVIEGPSLAFEEPPGHEAVRVIAENAGLTDASFEGLAAVLRERLGARIVSISVAGNKLSAPRILDSPNSLRCLSAGGNRFTRPPSLLGCTFLVDLDLSYTHGLFDALGYGEEELGDEEDEGGVGEVISPPFRHLSSLGRLNLCSVGLHRLCAPRVGSLLAGLVSLKDLCVAENEVGDLDDLALGLGAAAGLEELDAKENPVTEGRAYRARVSGLLPSLVSLDGRSLVLTTSSTANGRVADGRGASLVLDAPAADAFAGNIEVEFDAALKGHRDTSVVS